MLLPSISHSVEVPPMLKTILALALVFAVIAAPVIGFANSGGAPSGYTGSPLYQNGDTCTKCHVGTVNSGPGTVAIMTPSMTYAPGSIIPIDVALTGTLKNATKNGYQIMAAENGKTFAAPGWTIVDPAVTRQIAGHVMQTRAGTAQRAWKHYLRTPTAASGLRLWAAGNDGDGNNRNTGDLTYTTNMNLTAGRVPLSLDGAQLPQVGTKVQWNLDVASDANKPYVIGASFNNWGIPAGNNRKIPLAVDNLLVGTVQLAFPFFQGYQGILDASGKARATFNIPNFAALTGLTVHHAFVVVDAGQPNSIGTISNPYPLTIL